MPRARFQHRRIPFANPISTALSAAFDGWDSLSKIAVGGPINQWDDLSGNGNHLNDTAIAIPMRGHFQGIPCASFAGGQNLRSAVFGVALSQPNTVFLIPQITSAGAQMDCFDGQTTTRHLMYCSPPNAGMFAGTVLASSTSLLASMPNIIAAIFNGASSKLYVNGGAAAVSGNAGAQTLGRIEIGANYAATSPVTGRIFGAYVFNAALSVANLTTFGQYLGARYGVSVSTYT